MSIRRTYGCRHEYEVLQNDINEIMHACTPQIYTYKLQMYIYLVEGLAQENHPIINYQSIVIIVLVQFYL